MYLLAILQSKKSVSPSGERTIAFVFFIKY